jgi:peptidoglycan/xylan/chitin deacetylase (PgdA/CDA1 family)
MVHRTARALSVVALCVCAGLAAGATPSSSAPREICVTIDDLPWVSAVPRSAEEIERGTRTLLASFTRHDIPAIGFVNEGKLQRNGAADPQRVALLQRWLDAGLDLGNHTFSHRDLHATPLDVYQADIVRGEEVTTKLLAAAGRRPRYFRHPLLHTGRSLEIKLGLERFLARRGYRVAPVSVDNYDYLFARAYDRAAEKERSRVADAYIDYMTAIVAYYEQQSVAIVGREIRQILLLHASALNADTMERLVAMLKGRGYTFITLDRALEDPAYQSQDTYTGPAGVTWLHRWALTAGKRGNIFAGEPGVPAWIERASAAR